MLSFQRSGEIYYQTEDREEAIKTTRNLWQQMNPKNEGAKRMLEKIRGEKP